MAKLKMCSRPQPILKFAVTWSELTEIFLRVAQSLKENIVADLLLGGLHLQLSFLKAFLYLL